MPSARRVSWAKFRVAAVSLVAVLILSILLYLLAGGTLLAPKARIYIYLPDATGLAKGSEVRVDGITIGKVDDVSLSDSPQPNRVIKVRMVLEQKHLNNIPVDSWAQLTAETLVGDKYVDITSGTSPNHIRPESEIPYKEQLEMMKSVDLTQFERQLRTVDALLSDIQEGKNRVGQFVLGDQMYKDLLRQVEGIRSAVHAAASVTSPGGSALYTDKLYREISAPLHDLDQSLARIQSGQGSLGAFLRDDAQYQQAVAELRDLRRSVSDLRSSDFMRSDAMYRDWNRSLTQLISSVDEVNAAPLISTSQMIDNLSGAAKEVRDSIKDFRENPRKYMRIKIF